MQNRIGRSANSGPSLSAAGAISEDAFKASFESGLPNIKVDSYKDLVAECRTQATMLENANNDWTKRTHALKILRALIKNDISRYHSFPEEVYSLLGNALVTSVGDLRSSLCKEACITIAYYSQKLGVGFWRVCEPVLPITLNLTQNSAKIMASAGQNCNKWIATYVHHSKVLSTIVEQKMHKAKEVRRMLIELVKIIINEWDQSMIEKHSTELLQTIKLAINDADPEARATARQVFESLQNRYPLKAEALFLELEPNRQKQLMDRTSTASSTHSINSERDNLPTSNRGLYGAQSAFLNKRSASDLNHAVRQVKLIPPRFVHRPNVKSGARPPQATPTMQTPLSTPLNSRTLPTATPTKMVHPPNPTTAVTPKIPLNPTTRLQKSQSQMSANNPPHPNPTRPNITSQREIVYSPKSLIYESNAAKNVTSQRGGEYYSPKSSLIYDSNATTKSQPSSRSNSPNRSQHRLPAPLLNGNGSAFQQGWTYLSAEELANDAEKQDEFIQKICDALSDRETSEKEAENSLQILTRMIREGGITRWDAYFNNIFFAIQQCISHPMNDSLGTRICALKAMKELCNKQSKRLVTKTELLLMNILNAHENEDATVVRAAEDCGSALAKHLPTNTCMNLLMTVIDDDKSKYHQLSGAIKMLSNVIAKLPPEEVEKSLPAIAERMIRCYENSQSMVRRASIICLVSISNAVGLEKLKTHLNQSTLKLVEVYAARMTKKDNNGS